MTVLIAYSTSAEGKAALAQGRAIAARLSLGVDVFDLERVSRSADRRVDPAEAAEAGERWFAPPNTAPTGPEDLLDTARELGVEAIVVGVRRRSPVGKILLGSIAQRIILGADVPVISVKVAGGDA